MESIERVRQQCPTSIQKITRIPSDEYLTLMEYEYYLKENCRNPADHKILEDFTYELIEEAAKQGKIELKIILLGHQGENIYCRKSQDKTAQKKDIEDECLQCVEQMNSLYDNLESVTADDIVSNKYILNGNISTLYAHLSMQVMRFSCIVNMNLQLFGKAQEIIELSKKFIKLCETNKLPEDELDLIRSYAAYIYGRYSREFSFSDKKNALVHRNEAASNFLACAQYMECYLKSHPSLMEVLEPCIVLNKLHFVRCIIGESPHTQLPDKIADKMKLEDAKSVLEQAKETNEKVAKRNNIVSANRSRIMGRFATCNAIICYQIMLFHEDNLLQHRSEKSKEKYDSVIESLKEAVEYAKKASLILRETYYREILMISALVKELQNKIEHYIAMVHMPIDLKDEMNEVYNDCKELQKLCLSTAESDIQ